MHTRSPSAPCTTASASTSARRDRQVAREPDDQRAPDGAWPTGWERLVRKGAGVALRTRSAEQTVAPDGAGHHGTRPALQVNGGVMQQSSGVTGEPWISKRFILRR